jgi:hypothetical protein
MYEELKPRGFQPLGVAFNEMASVLLPDFLKQTQPNFPIGYAQRDPVLSFLQHPAILRFVVPQFVLIDRKGMIRGQTTAEGSDDFYDEKNMRARIEALLNEPAGAARKKSNASFHQRLLARSLGSRSRTRTALPPSAATKRGTPCATSCVSALPMESAARTRSRN